ncbi:MAG: hypothetical protein U5R49_17620 [Deltaproteobacteria bacterium]|nr:hypothetical protein [Deltaproteobacteria bacterium]
METWRLLDTPPMTAAENMALDEILVALKGEGKTPNTIHFLQFDPRAVLVGFHQSISEEIRLAYCRENGIDINRRVTGGGPYSLMKASWAGKWSAIRGFLI